MEQYYPVNDNKNNEMAERYRELASKESEIEKAQSFFKALEISLKAIEQDYKKYMKVEVKDEIV